MANIFKWCKSKCIYEIKYKNICKYYNIREYEENIHYYNGVGNDNSQQLCPEPLSSKH